MKKLLIGGALLAYLNVPGNGLAALSNSCTAIDNYQFCDSYYDDGDNDRMPGGCSNGTLKGSNTACYFDCSSCKSGFRLITESGNGYTWHTCVMNGLNCVSDTVWSFAANGYEKFTVSTYGACDECSEETEYRCASGYYGTATSSMNGCTACPSNATCAGGNNSTFSCNKGYYKDGASCTRCPSSGGAYGTTSAAGATAITQCYIPSGSTFNDGTGSGTYTGDCYYKL